jgi:hypothetical protein
MPQESKGTDNCKRVLIQPGTDWECDMIINKFPSSLPGHLHCLQMTVTSLGEPLRLPQLDELKELCLDYKLPTLSSPFLGEHTVINFDLLSKLEVLQIRGHPPKNLLRRCKGSSPGIESVLLDAEIELFPYAAGFFNRISKTLKLLALRRVTIRSEIDVSFPSLSILVIDSINVPSQCPFPIHTKGLVLRSDDRHYGLEYYIKAFLPAIQPGLEYVSLVTTAQDHCLLDSSAAALLGSPKRLLLDGPVGFAGDVLHSMNLQMILRLASDGLAVPFQSIQPVLLRHQIVPGFAQSKWLRFQVPVNSNIATASCPCGYRDRKVFFNGLNFDFDQFESFRWPTLDSMVSCNHTNEGVGKCAGSVKGTDLGAPVWHFPGSEASTAEPKIFRPVRLANRT